MCPSSGEASSPLFRASRMISATGIENRDRNLMTACCLCSLTLSKLLFVTSADVVLRTSVGELLSISCSKLDISAARRELARLTALQLQLAVSPPVLDTRLRFRLRRSSTH